jgi:hypothetical protein
MTKQHLLEVMSGTVVPEVFGTELSCTHCGQGLHPKMMTRDRKRKGKTPLHIHSHCSGCGIYHVTEISNGEVMLHHLVHYIVSHPVLQAKLEKLIGANNLNLILGFGHPEGIAHVPFVDLTK